jgi:hypothetical protein
MGLRLRSTVLTLLLWAGCRFDVDGLNEDAVLGPCLGTRCACADTTTCAPSCGPDGNLDGCELACERLDDCNATCTDDCQLACSHARSCATSCGDGCAVTCEAVGACDFSCGHDCHVRCTDVSDCKVEMLDGEVECDRVGGCEVTCVAADGQRRRAELDREGRAVCATASLVVSRG